MSIKTHRLDISCQMGILCRWWAVESFLLFVSTRGFSLKCIKFVSVVVGFALLLQGVAPANASTIAPSYAAEDYISARLQAAITNHRILVISELSELSTTWVNPDGTLTTESFGAPVRVRDGAGEYGWRDLDFTLVFDDTGFVNAKSGRFDFKVSGGGPAAEVAADGLVSISGSDGNHFGFGWDFAFEVGKSAGEGALAGVAGGAIGKTIKSGVKSLKLPNLNEYLYRHPMQDYLLYEFGGEQLVKGYFDTFKFSPSKKTDVKPKVKPLKKVRTGGGGR